MILDYDDQGDLVSLEIPAPHPTPAGMTRSDGPFFLEILDASKRVTDAEKVEFESVQLTLR